MSVGCSRPRQCEAGGKMNGYNFTDRVRKVLQMAREEAARLHHEYVGTEHILLGLIREGEGVAAAVLTNLNVDLEDIDRKSTRLNSSHVEISYAVFCLKKKKRYTS